MRERESRERGAKRERERERERERVILKSRVTGVDRREMGERERKSY